MLCVDGAKIRLMSKLLKAIPVLKEFDSFFKKFDFHVKQSMITFEY